MGDIGIISLVAALVMAFIVMLLASLLIGSIFSKISRWLNLPVSPWLKIALGAAIVPLLLSALALSTYLQTNETHASQGYGLLFLYPAGLALFAWLVVWPLSCLVLRRFETR